MRKRGAIEVDTLIPWIIATLVLVLVVVGLVILNKKGIGDIGFIKNIFNFGG